MPLRFARHQLIGRYVVQRYSSMHTGERGAAAVELALVLFPLLMLLLGVVEFGRYYSVKLSFSQAAGSAAREIALHHDDPGLDVDATLQDLLPVALADLDTKTVVICSTTEPDAIVALADSVDLAIPLATGTIGSVGVAARARVPCEG